MFLVVFVFVWCFFWWFFGERNPDIREIGYIEGLVFFQLVLACLLAHSSICMMRYI